MCRPTLFVPAFSLLPSIHYDRIRDDIRQFFSFDLLKISRNIREYGVPLNHDVDNGEINPVCQGYSLPEDLSAAADKNLVRAPACGERRLQVMNNNTSFGSIVSLSGEDDIFSAGQRTAYTLECLPAQNDRVSHRNFMKPLPIGGNPPWHLVIATNDPIFRHGCYEGDNHISGVSDGPIQIALTFCFREPFDRIPQHGSRHFFVILLQKLLFGSPIALAHFAQHPTHGLVDQIVVVR